MNSPRPPKKPSNFPGADRLRAARTGDRSTPTSALQSLAQLANAVRGSSDGSPPLPHALPDGSYNLDVLGRVDATPFNKEVQTRLADFGLYDRQAIDGEFGPLSEWALAEFRRFTGLGAEHGLGPQTAQVLLSARVEDILPVFIPNPPGGHFAERLIHLYMAGGHWFSRHPECRNIVYLEGVNPDGVLNDDAPNRFNDLRVVFRIDESGRPQIMGKWEGTTEPGRFYTEIAPMNPAGAARIAFGQYFAWTVGIHNHDHEALCQVKPVSVYRDKNRDYKRSGDNLDTGLFSINQHWGYNNPVGDLGRSSAGCLVGRTQQGHREFMSIVKRDPRYVATKAYRFTTTILDGVDL